MTPINTEAIRAHLPLNLRRASNNSPTRIHQRPHLIRTPLPRRPPNLLIPQRLAKRIRNLPRMRPDAIAPVVTSSPPFRRRASFVFGTWSRCRVGCYELLKGRQRALGELRGGRGGEGLQVVPHSGGVGAGFFADLGLLGGREAGHGDVFAAEVGWSGLVIFVSFRVGCGLTWSKVGCGTNDLDCSRLIIVVCGPAAAVEGTEEGAHFGSEGGRLMGHLPFDGVDEGFCGRRGDRDSLCDHEAGCSVSFCFASLQSRCLRRATMRRCQA